MTLKKPLKNPLLWGIVAALIVLILDQVSKWLILHKMGPSAFPVKVLPIFDLVLVFNRGISFGLFTQNAQTGVLMLTLMTFAIIIVLLVWLWRLTVVYMAVAIGLIIGGAFGNMLDRIWWGAVVDFLHFHWQSYAFPAFNVADTFITIGAGLIVLDGLFISKEKPYDTQ
jgi:signal peptidase II